MQFGIWAIPRLQPNGISKRNPSIASPQGGRYYRPSPSHRGAQRLRALLFHGDRDGGIQIAQQVAQEHTIHIGLDHVNADLVAVEDLAQAVRETSQDFGFPRREMHHTHIRQAGDRSDNAIRGHGGSGGSRFLPDRDDASCESRSESPGGRPAPQFVNAALRLRGALPRGLTS